MKPFFVRSALVVSLMLGMAACGESPTSNEEPDYAVISTFMGTGEAALGAEGVGPLETHLYLPQDLMKHFLRRVRIQQPREHDGAQPAAMLRQHARPFNRTVLR